MRLRPAPIRVMVGISRYAKPVSLIKTSGSYKGIRPMFVTNRMDMRVPGKCVFIAYAVISRYDSMTFFQFEHKRIRLRVQIFRNP